MTNDSDANINQSSHLRLCRCVHRNCYGRQSSNCGSHARGAGIIYRQNTYLVGYVGWTETSIAISVWTGQLYPTYMHRYEEHDVRRIERPEGCSPSPP